MPKNRAGRRYRVWVLVRIPKTCNTVVYSLSVGTAVALFYSLSSVRVFKHLRGSPAPAHILDRV